MELYRWGSPSPVGALSLRKHPVASSIRSAHPCMALHCFWVYSSRCIVSGAFESHNPITGISVLCHSRKPSLKGEISWALIFHASSLNFGSSFQNFAHEQTNASRLISNCTLCVSCATRTFPLRSMGGKKGVPSQKQKAADKAKDQAAAEAQAKEDAAWAAAGIHCVFVS